jgi:AcrR family transcriptional regulator
MSPRRTVPETRSMSERLRLGAHELLDAEGPTALSVRRLAVAVDVAPMTIYHQFGSKDGIVEVLVRDGFEQLRAALAAVGISDDPLGDLRAGAHEYRRLALGRPHLYSLMFERAVPGFEPSESCMMTAGSSFTVLVDCIGAGQATVIVDGDPVELAQRLWATMHGLVTLELHDYGFVDNRDRHYTATIDTMLRGLSREPGDLPRRPKQAQRRR